MQKLKIEKPNQIQKQINTYLRNSDEAKYIHRLHGILLLINNDENNCANIASLFKNSPRSLSNWVHRVNESGIIDVLRDKPRTGRLPRLNDKQLEHLKEILQEHPSEVGVNANIWDGKSLSYYIDKKYSITLQVRQCQRLFHMLGFSLKRARPIVAKGDPEKKKQVKKLHQIMQTGKYDIYFEDECHFKLTLTIIRAWFLAGTTPQIKSPTDRFKLSVYGAMGCNGQLIIHSEETFDSDSFKRFLEELLKNANTDKKILLVLDNARYHHANKLKDYIHSIKDRLKLFFLPAYSLDINAIEMLWKKTRRGVTHNRYFSSLKKMKKSLLKFWCQFKDPNEELAKLCAFI